MFNLGAFLSYVFVVTFTPGPNNIMSMANASKYGFKKTLEFMAGIFTGFFIIMIVCSYFNLLLFNILPKFKIFMGVIGASFMIYLAIKIMTSKEEIDAKDKGKAITEDFLDKSKKDMNNVNSFFTGITMQFVNPKVLIYCITVISNFIIPYYKSNLTLILFSLLLAAIAFISTSCWALSGSLFSKFLSKYRKQFNVVMGLLLIYSAFSISGISHLFY